MQKLLFLLLFSASTLFCTAQTKIFTIDASTVTGTFKDLAGVNGGPAAARIGYQDAQISSIRTHDYPPSCDYYGYSDFWQNGMINNNFDPADPSQYTWTDLNQKIDTIILNNYKALFRLGIRFPGNDNTIPRDPPFDANGTTFTNFAELCKRTVMHFNNNWGVSGRTYDLKEWEVWNEPDGAGNFWTGTPAQFFNMYKSVSDSLKNLDNTLNVGGPSILSGSIVSKRPDYFHDFIVFCHDNNVALDFFSWHMYKQYNPWGVKEHGDYVRHVLDSVGLTATKSYITEMNVDLGQSGNPDLNSPKGAAYVASALMSIQQSKIDKVFWYRGEGIMNLLGEDSLGMPQYTWNGLGFKAITTLINETPNPLSSTGNEVVTGLQMANNDTTNVMIMAGKSDAGEQLDIVLSNYNSNYSQLDVMLQNLSWNATDSVELTVNTIQGPGMRFTSTLSSTTVSSLTVSVQNAQAPAVYLLQLKNKTLSGINAQNKIENLSFYPNPSAEGKYTCTSGFFTETVNIILYNALGQEVKALHIRPVNNVLCIDLADLKDGIYTCSATVKSKRLVSKIVKLQP